MSLNHNNSYNQQIRAWLKKNFEYAQYLSQQNLNQRDCPVCKSAESVFFANNGYLDYVQCQDCALVYMNPTLDLAAVQRGFQGDDQLLMDYFKIIAQFRTAPSTGTPDPLLDNKLKDIYRYKSHGKLLDIGCSVGDFLHKAQHFYDVEGLEINSLTASIAEQRFRVHKDYLHNLIAGDFTEFSKRYDIVSMHQILYGVPDPVGLLKDIHTILKDDGILYINTPNTDSYAMRLFKGKSNHLYGYTTQNVFNRRSLEKLAACSGFKVIFFRTEWLDIYYMDIIAYLENEVDFIHKRNSHLPGYEEHIAMEDALQSKMNLDLGCNGNYMITVLKKC
jgi:SAM-dependent methyltransferase